MKKIPVAVTMFSLLILFASLHEQVSLHAVGDSELKSAGDYQLLSGAALTIGASIVGLDPINSGTSTSAIADLNSAIMTMSMVSGTPISADLGGKTYLPGSYSALSGTAFTMTSNVVLDGKGDCNSRFYFVTPAAMNTTAGISITLINQAKASNVYWVSGAAITIGASSNLVGNFLSAAAITVGASSSIDGRFLAIAALTVGASVIFEGFPPSACAQAIGALAISVPAATHLASLNPGASQSFELGSVVVTDTRGSAIPWVVEAQCLAISNSQGDRLDGEFFSYSLNELLSQGGAILTPHPLNSLRISAPVLTATTGTLSNGATWKPLLTISIPLDQPSGEYSGVITHSIY